MHQNIHQIRFPSLSLKKAFLVSSAAKNQSISELQYTSDSVKTDSKRTVIINSHININTVNSNNNNYINDIKNINVTNINNSKSPESCFSLRPCLHGDAPPPLAAACPPDRGAWTFQPGP